MTTRVVAGERARTRGRWPGRWMRGATWRAAVRASSSRVAAAPASLLVAPALVAGGVAVLAWDYALLPAAPVNYVLYWSALGCVLAGVWFGGTAGRPSSTRRIVAL